MIEDCGWPASLHVIGKDILRFHAIYWPAMLFSAGLKVPTKVFGHGFLTREGKKMGKSLGNILDPTELLEHYGIDSLRWYLLKDIQFGQDGDFQSQRFIDLVNNDLANTIGNLVNRTSSMARKWFNNSIPHPDQFNDDVHPLKTQSLNTVENYLSDMSNCSFHLAADSILKLATAANLFLNEKAPWKLIKESGKENVVAHDIYSVLESCRIVGLLTQPLVPDFSVRLLSQLGISFQPDDWRESLNWGGLLGGAPLPTPQPIMTKLEKFDSNA